jgi:hypothetical protein
MCFAYLLQLMDKTTLSYSTLLGLVKDTVSESETNILPRQSLAAKLGPDMIRIL